MASHNEEILGVDVGAARIGIARAGTAASLAEPLKTVPAAAAEVELESLVKDRNVSYIVVGRPRNLKGEETGQTRAVKDWAERLQRQLKLPFYWQDEALTSRTAEGFKSHPAGSDAVAAALILQDFLDSHESDRVAV